jgi:hypothetical protein
MQKHLWHIFQTALVSIRKFFRFRIHLNKIKIKTIHLRNFLFVKFLEISFTSCAKTGILIPSYTKLRTFFFYKLVVKLIFKNLTCILDNAWKLEIYIMYVTTY